MAQGPSISVAQWPSACDSDTGPLGEDSVRSSIVPTYYYRPGFDLNTGKFEGSFNAFIVSDNSMYDNARKLKSDVSDPKAQKQQATKKQEATYSILWTKSC